MKKERLSLVVKKRRSAEYTRTTFKLYLNKYTVEQNRRDNQDWTIQRHWAHKKGRRQKKSITGVIAEGKQFLPLTTYNTHWTPL
jgi:hypothetical protein